MTYRAFTALALAACMTPSDEVATDPFSGGKADGGDVGLPADLPPWGGPDATRWAPEAVLANAATAELQRDPDARVSIPAALWSSSFAPFGDGQTDAAVVLGAWTGARPPVIGVRHGRRIVVRIDRELPFDGDAFELWAPDGTWVQSIGSARDADGSWRVELADPPPALADRLVVSPRGWRDGFPLDFGLPVTPVAALAGTLPSQLQHLPGGESVVDPVGAARGTPVDVLRSTSFPEGFVNQQPFTSSDVHAVFPQGGAPRITAVGGDAAWVAEAPFKNVYICFDRRSLDAEAQHGVPSGAGWHRIGDPGESILASLERAPLLVGHAAGASLAPPAGGQHAYGLASATTYGLLRPGQAFTTARGDFHWFAIHHATDPCVQVWMHRCAPDANAPSMACAGD